MRKMTNRNRAIAAGPMAAMVILLGATDQAVAGLFEYAGNTLQAELRPDQVVPVATSPAIGAATFVIDPNANTLTYRMVYGLLGSAEVAAEIRGPALPGVNGPVVHTLSNGHIKSGVWNYPQAIEADLLEGRLYVLIRSVNNPNGELRGQIGHFVATLTGTQVVPPVTTTGRGWGTFTVDRQARQLKYHIVISGLTAAETQAQLVVGDLHGFNAFAFTPLPMGAVKTGVWNYQEGDEEFHLTNGRVYVLIRTTAFPDGELRGQVSPLIVPLDGQQMVPAVSTSGIGIAHVSICTHCNRLSYFFRTVGLSSAQTTSHISGFVPMGQNGTEFHTLPAGNPKVGSWPYAIADEGNVLDGLTYFTVKTSNFPNGEVRGQVYAGTGPIVIKPPSCPSDLNGDTLVNGLDLGILLGSWSIPAGTPGCGGALPCLSDLNGDGTVNGLDLGILLGNWSIPATSPGCGG